MKAHAVSRMSVSADQNPVQRNMGEGRLAVVASDGSLRSRASQPVRLTARQLDVLALLCEGLPNKLICRRLSISPGTVKAHISSILRELCVSSRLQAVVWARRSGLVANRSGAEADPDANEASAESVRSVDFTREDTVN